MSRFASLFSQRVPLYVWLPIVLACAAAGFIASTLRPVIPNEPHIPRSERPSRTPVTASPAEDATKTAKGQLSRAIGPPRDAPSVVLPTDETDLATPAPSAADRHAHAPDVGQSAPPAPAMKVAPKAVRTDHALAKARRPQRTAQQPAKAPSTSSASLKNIPLIGPVFSLFQ